MKTILDKNRLNMNYNSDDLVLREDLKWIKLSEVQKGDKIFVINKAMKGTFQTVNAVYSYTGKGYRYLNKYNDCFITDLDFLSGDHYIIKNYFSYSGTLDIKEPLMRLITMMYNVDKRNGDRAGSYTVSIPNSRKRKRCIELLKLNNIKYIVNSNEITFTCCKINIKRDTYPAKFYKLSANAESVFLDELKYWGCYKYSEKVKVFISADRDGADLIAFIAHSLGYGTRTYAKMRGNTLTYCIAIKNKNRTRCNKLKKETNYMDTKFIVLDVDNEKCTPLIRTDKTCIVGKIYTDKHSAKKLENIKKTI